MGGELNAMPRANANEISLDGADATERLRVLFVVDSIYWITGTIARQISEYNPWIEATICSDTVLRKILSSYAGRFPGEIDLVHFLSPYIATEFISVFRPVYPCVATIHHVEGEVSVAAARRADAVMTVCDQWHAVLPDWGFSTEQCIKVPNGVDASFFRPGSPVERNRARRRHRIPLRSVSVGFSAKQSSDSNNRKGVQTLIAAVRALAQQLDVTFMIVGPGWSDLVEELKRQGVRCVYSPFLVDRSEVAEFYRAIDVYWVTSKIEGGPVPLLESMSSGVVSISTPVGVALEAIEHGVNGFVVPFDEPEAYASITAAMFDTPEKRMRIGAAARRTIIDRFQASHTTLAARGLYAIADRFFQARHPTQRSRPAQVNVGSKAGNNERKTGWLASLPPETHARLSAEEELAFMSQLLQLGAISAARRLASRAVRADPLNADVWRRAALAFPKTRRLVRFLYTPAKKMTAGVPSGRRSSG